MQLFHCLYVYPSSVSLSRKRNLFIRVELRKDDADVRRQPLEVTLLISIHTERCLLCIPHLTCYVFIMTRQFIQGSRVFHSRSGLTHKLLLGLGWPITMMRLKFHSQLSGHLCITSYSLFSMLIYKQNWKLQNQ